MTILFAIVYIGAYIVSPTVATGENALNGISLPVALLLDSFMFTAGLLVLIQGITMMVNELRDCIKGISQRFIKGAVMSVDASLILKTQPTAVMLGFLTSFAGCIVTMVISFVLHGTDAATFSAVVLPSVVVFFFLGGTAGIFGNYRGGIIGCLLAGFVVGLVVSFVPIIFNATLNTLSSAPI
jgi:PTS system ascorbate-specific IIC component